MRRDLTIMKLQISTDYAVRILQYLHRQSGEVQAANSIAQSIDITYPFFIKVANQLKKHELVSSVQGRNGGYALGRAAQEISLYDVFLCMEGELNMNRCLKTGGPCENGEVNNCKLHTFLHSLQEKLIAELSAQSIADLAG